MYAQIQLEAKTPAFVTNDIWICKDTRPYAFGFPRTARTPYHPTLEPIGAVASQYVQPPNKLIQILTHRIAIVLVLTGPLATCTSEP